MRACGSREGRSPGGGRPAPSGAVEGRHSLPQSMQSHMADISGCGEPGAATGAQSRGAVGCWGSRGREGTAARAALAAGAASERVAVVVLLQDGARLGPAVRLAVGGRQLHRLPRGGGGGREARRVSRVPACSSGTFCTARILKEGGHTGQGVPAGALPGRHKRAGCARLECIPDRGVRTSTASC